MDRTMTVTNRRSLFAGALVAVSLLGDSYLYAVLPVHHAEAGVSLVAVGWLLSVNRWIRFLSNPLAGAVGPRLGWGWAFAGALWLTVATTAGYGLLTGVAALTVVRALWGVSWSFLRLGGMAAVLADSPPGRRGRLMGLFSGIYRIGSLVGVAAGGLLADRLGYAGAALLFAGATAAGAVVASFPSALDGRWGAPARDAAGSNTPTGFLGNWLPASLPEWTACLSGAALQLVVSGMVTGTIGLLVKERLGAQIEVGPWMVGPATVAGLILASRFGVDLLVGPAAGHWADRRGRGVALGAMAMTATLSLALLGRAASLSLIALSAIFLFVSGSGIATLLDGWAGDLAGRAPGRFLPAYNTWLDFGAALGPILAYHLTARIGLTMTYGAGAVGLLVAMAVWGLFRRRLSWA